MDSNNTPISPLDILGADPNSALNTPQEQPTNTNTNDAAMAAASSYNPSVGTPNTSPISAPDMVGGSANSDKILADAQARILGVRQQDGAYAAYDGSVVDTSGRYPRQVIGADNEDIYGQNQSWGSKALNGIGKGLVTAGTTFISGTAGLVDGIFEAAKYGDFSKFSDNSVNNLMSNINKGLENSLPNYYTQTERNANWYSPSRWLTANFFWDKFVKNLGFVAGAALTGGVYSKALSLLPTISKSWTVGGALDALAESETGAAAAVNNTGTSFISNTLGKIGQKANKFLNLWDVSSTAHRVATATLGAIGESSLEAMNNAQQYKEEKIQDYINKNGVSPNESQLAQIDEEARGVNESSFFLNMGLLSATNFVQFPKLLGSQSEQKAIAEAVGGETNSIRRLTNGTYEAIEAKNKFAKFFKDYYKVGFAPSEAFEEGAQNAIQVGTSNYYSKKNSKEGSDFMDSLLEGVRQTVTTNDGMEQILLGGISGGLSQSGIANKLTGGRFSKYISEGTLGEIKNRAANTQAFVEALNSNKGNVDNYLKSLAESAKRGVRLNNDMFAAQQQGDMQESKDLEHDATINYLTPRVKYGRMDIVRSELADLKSLASTDDGLQQLKDDGKASEYDTKESFIQRLENISKTAEDYNKAYDVINKRFAGIEDVNKDTGEINKRYSNDVLEKMAYAHSKIYDYDRRISTILQESNASGYGHNMTEVLDSSTDDERLPEAFDSLISSVNESDTIMPLDRQDAVDKARDIVEMSKRRAHYINEFMDLQNNPSKYAETSQIVATPDSTEEEQKPQTVNIDGNEYSVNIPYYTGITATLDSNQTYILNPHTVTILGENEDGTVKAQDQDGNIKDYNKSDLSSYRLFVGNSINSNFYTANQGADYDLRMGNRSVRGRLEYNPSDDRMEFSYKDNRKLNKIPVNKDMFSGAESALLIPVNSYTQEQQEALQEYSNKSETVLSNAVITRIGGLVNDFTSKINDVRSKIEEKRNQLFKIESELEELKETVRKTDDLKASRKKLGKDDGILSTKALRGAINTSNKLISFKNEVQEDINSLQDKLNDLTYQRDFISAMITNAESSKEFSSRVINMYDNLEDMIKDGNKKLNIISNLRDKISKTIEKSISFLRHQVFKFEQKYPKDSLATGQLTLQQIKSNPNFLQDNITYQEDMNLLASVIDETESVVIQPNEKRVVDITNTIKELRDNIEEYHKELEVVGKVYDALAEIQDEINKESEQADTIQTSNVEGPNDTNTEGQEQAQKEEESARGDEDIPESDDDIEPEDSEGGITEENPGGTILGKIKKVYEDTKKKVISRLFNATTAPRTLNSDQKRHSRFLNNISASKVAGDDNRAIRVTRSNQNSLGLNGLIERQLGDMTDPNNTNEGLILRVYVRNVDDAWWAVDEDNNPTYKLPDWGGIPELQEQYNNSIKIPVNTDAELKKFIDTPSEYFKGIKKDRYEALNPIIDYIRDNNLMPKLAQAAYDGVKLEDIGKVIGNGIVQIDENTQASPKNLYMVYKEYAIGNTPSQQQEWLSKYSNLLEDNINDDVQQEIAIEQTPTVDLSKIIYSVLPTTSLKFNENGDTRYSKATPEEAQAMSDKWSKERARTFNVSDGYVIEDYSISKGTLNEDGVEKALTENFTTEEDLKDKSVLKFNKKGIYITDGDNTYYPNIRNFTSKELKNISTILEKISKDPKQLDEYIGYLRGLMYISPIQENEKINPKQVYFDIKNGVLHLGETQLNFEDIPSNKSKIQQFFQKAGINPRNKDIYDISTPYKEIVKVNTTTPDVIAIYPNFQSFLVSSEQEIDGKILKRDINTIPLTTKVVAGRDNMYGNRYSYNETLANNEEPEIQNISPINQPPLTDNDTPTIEDCN